MGVIVTLENGDQIDGEDFVIGMAASELSYAREEEALKAWHYRKCPDPRTRRFISGT